MNLGTRWLEEAELTGYDSSIGTVGKSRLSEVCKTIGIEEWQATNVFTVCIQLERRRSDITLAGAQHREREQSQQCAAHGDMHDEGVYVEEYFKERQECSKSVKSGGNS